MLRKPSPGGVWVGKSLVPELMVVGGGLLGFLWHIYGTFPVFSIGKSKYYGRSKRC